MITLRLECSGCGAYLQQYDTPARNLLARQEWEAMHSGEGHGGGAGKRVKSPVLAALHRLKALLGKERAACERMARESLAEGDRMGARQCDVAGNSYSIAMAWIDIEIHRAKEGR